MVTHKNRSVPHILLCLVFAQFQIFPTTVHASQKILSHHENKLD